MNVLSPEKGATVVKKQIFTLKPIQKDGLLVQVHHSISCKNGTRDIRFVHSTFNQCQLILANADIEGNIFIIDFGSNKYWSLPKFNSCTVLAFSNLNLDDLIIGTNDGRLYVVHVHFGTIRVVLEGHSYPVKNISFAGDYCLSASLSEAIVFSLRDFKKIYKLSLDIRTSLKFVYFTPVSHYVVACFVDDCIQVWKNETFEIYKQIIPSTWKRMPIKCVAFSRNGALMAIGGYSTSIVIFTLDLWNVSKILHLPAGINAVRCLEFLSQPYDCGANKFLVLLSSHGIIYFLDLQTSLVISKIQKEAEIVSFSCCSFGTHLACVLHSGIIEVYKIHSYLEYKKCNKEDTKSDPKKIKLFLPPLKQVTENLDLDNLRRILKEYGEYPEAYRTLIWSTILQLPKNQKAYAVLHAKPHQEYENKVEQEYPLASKCARKNLKRTISALGGWCPQLYELKYIPLFAFPFVKIFENDPVACFEALCTIILNWCQHWFQYAPGVPINVLSMVENVLKEHDLHLWKYFSSRSIPPTIYVWSLLEVAFSEVLTIKQWSILWDHILSNEPSFFLMCAAAYSIINRTYIMSLSRVEDVQSFFHNQNAIDFQKFIAKSYYINDNTSQSNHPRQYLKNFQKLPNGVYPKLNDFPALLNNNNNNTQLKKTKNEIDKIKEETEQRYSVSKEKEEDEIKQAEDVERLQYLEDYYYDQMLKEKERIENQRIHLSEMKTKLHKQQAESFEKSRKKIEETNKSERKRELNRLLKNLKHVQKQGDLEIKQAEEELSKHHVELLEQKEKLEQLLSKNEGGLTSLGDLQKLEGNQKKMSQELKDIRKRVQFNRLVNTIEIPARISMISDSVQEVDVGVAKDATRRDHEISQTFNITKIQKMESDTDTLEKEVESLLSIFTESKINEAKELLEEVKKSAEERRELIEKSGELIEKLKRLDKEFTNL